jgi:hypothetical protein
MGEVARQRAGGSRQLVEGTETIAALLTPTDVQKLTITFSLTQHPFYRTLLGDEGESYVSHTA